MPTRLPLSFKGGRDYLHGSDMFNALVALTGAPTAISFQMHRVARHALDAMAVPAGQPTGDFCARFEYGGQEDRHCIGLREDPSSEVTARAPYDEAAVIADARLSGDRIESPGPGGATFIERVLALNKALLNARFAPAAIKWWFTRLDLDAVPTGPQSIAVTFIASVGARLTKSAIEADGSPAGYVYFSRDRQ